MSRSALELKSFQVDESGNRTAIFTGRHSTVGRQGTVLEFSVLLRQHLGGKWEASLQVENCEADSPMEAIKRLGGWAARIAETLEVDEEWFKNDSQLPIGSRL